MPRMDKPHFGDFDDGLLNLQQHALRQCARAAGEIQAVARVHLFGQPKKKFPECILHLLHVNLLVGEQVFRVHGMHDHGVVDLEYQQLAVSGFRAVDAEVVELGALIDRIQRVAVALRKVARSAP